MELALYCPVYGYYEKEADIIGRRGDYFTSVSVGELFGQLLACQFSQWANAAPAETRGRLELVEAGAHRGDLARDILAWFQAFCPDLFGRLQYWIVEPSDVRRSLQERALSSFDPLVRWAASLERLPAEEPQYRILFSNELLDAFPVYRLGWDAHQHAWFEWGVACGEAGFEWVRMPLSTTPASKPRQGQMALASESALELLQTQLNGLGTSAGEGPGSGSQRLLEVLPDGFTMEISPMAAQWWREAAAGLVSGKLLTIDYGHTFDQLLTPERCCGTLRAYRGHQAISDVLAAPGLQDITADVNFTLLQEAGLRAGLQAEFFGSQANFLTRVAAGIWDKNYVFGEWTGDCTRQFQTLTHPDHLGNRFNVLVQATRDSLTDTAARS